MKKITEKNLKEAINQIAATDEGKVLLAAIMHQCNWNTTIVAADPVQTHYYAAMRGVWGGIRRNIKVEHLKKIEYDYVISTEKVKKDE